MPTSPKARKFNQTSRITAHLRDLVRRYPKGLGLVKEFLQNADDAGASYLHVTYDRRRHPGQLSTPEQGVVLGPALLFANDRPFGDTDIEGIQHVHESGKIREARGTGRFGQGVNTFYSVSDHPTLLTRDYVVWFDPHWRAHGSERNAWAWSLEDVTKFWPAWAATFVPAGLTLGAAYFDGAVFRLPIRTVEDARRSEILDEAFTDNDFEGILGEVRKAGPSLLVFLRSIQSLRIDEIACDGTRRIRYAIKTTNDAEVEAAREPLREAVQGDPRELLERWLGSREPLPVASYSQSFQVFDDGRRSACSWSVVTGLFRGLDDRLLMQAKEICSHQEKVIPWAGAAAPLDPKLQASGLACFLPLPEAVPWRVLLHGWFDVDSSRKGITRQGDTGESSQRRALWNQSLLRDGVGLAWAALAELLRGDPAQAADPYRRWPRPSDANDDCDRALVESFYQEIGRRPVFRCVSSDGAFWRSLEGIGRTFWTLEEGWHSELREPLLANGNTLVEPPLPMFAVQALRQTTHPATVLSATTAREGFLRVAAGRDVDCVPSEAPVKALSRSDWIAAFARFCAEDGHDKLKGLPLALLADGKLHTFGSCGAIYLAADAERVLLERVAHRILDPVFQQQVGLTKPVPALGLKSLDLRGFLECVREVVASGMPGEAWCAQLFEHLERYSPTEVKANASAIQSLRLVFDQGGQLHQMGDPRTPRLASRMSRRLRTALERLGIPIASGSPELVAAVRRFALRHPDFVSDLTPESVVDALVLHARVSWLDEKALFEMEVLAPILDFLTPPDWVRRGDPRVDVLRRLPLLPTADGLIVSAEIGNIYLPGGFMPPQSFGVGQTLLNVGEEGRWAALYRTLRIAELDGFTYVVGALLPAFASASEEVRVRMLHWLRDQFRALKAELEPARWQKLVSEVCNAPILPLEGGGWEAPVHVYHPEAWKARQVLGGVARVPDVERLGVDGESWLEWFSELDLRRTPDPEDLIQALQRYVAEAEQQGIFKVRERLRQLREHIVDRWDSHA